MNALNNQSQPDAIRSRRLSVTSLVDLHELYGFFLTMVSTRDDAAAAARWLSSTAGVSVSTQVGAVHGGDPEVTVLGLGPGRWLLRGTGPLPAADGPAEIALFDLSDVWRLFQISGIAARRLLASGCPMDLDPRQFAPRQCALTRFDALRVLLCCTASDTYEMYVERSYAEDFRAHIVLRAAALTAPAELEA